jgi:O-antigen/teichoic acid export membrane protein
MSTSQFARQATKGFAWNHIYRVVDYGLWNVFIAVVARQLGPAIAAPFSVYMALAMPLALLGTLGVDGVLLRYLTRVSHEGRDDEGNDLTALPLLVLLVFAALIVLPKLAPGTAAALGSLSELAPFLIVFLAGQAMTAFATFALIGLLQVRGVFIASIIARSVLIVGLVASILTHSLTVWNAVAMHSASVLLNAVLLLVALNKTVRAMSSRAPTQNRQLLKPVVGVLRELKGFLFKPSFVKFFLLTPVMLYGVTTWGSDLLSSVLGRQPDILMMRIFFGEHSKEIGYYSVACQILLMTEYVCLFGLSGALVSVFSSLAHQDEGDPLRVENNYPRLSKARKEVMSYQAVAILPLCAFMYAFAPRLILFVFGPDYLQSGIVVRWGLLILATNIGLIGGGVHITSLVTIGKERLVFRYRLLWGMTNLVANYFLILNFGAIGALFGTQLANLGACAVESMFARRFIGSSFELSTTLSVSLIATGSGLVGYWAAEALTGMIPLFGQIVVGTVVTFGVCASLYIVLRIPSARRVFERLQRFVSPVIDGDPTPA